LHKRQISYILQLDGLWPRYQVQPANLQLFELAVLAQFVLTAREKTRQDLDAMVANLHLTNLELYVRGIEDDLGDY